MQRQRHDRQNVNVADTHEVDRTNDSDTVTVVQRQYDAWHRYEPRRITLASPFGGPYQVR